MVLIAFTVAEAEELLEFIEGEGSCALAEEPVLRLYDVLCERSPQSGCDWECSLEEAHSLLEPIGDCTDVAYSGCAEMLYSRLHAVCQS